MKIRSCLACLSLVLMGGCGHPPSVYVSPDPPARPASQSADLPPADILDADLVVTVSGKHRNYCFGVDELLSWLDSENVHDQKWTQLGDRQWRLDGFAFDGKEHTVWVFEQSHDGVELIGYRDSAKAGETPESIMKAYYPRMSTRYMDPVRRKYGNCKDPYD